VKDVMWRSHARDAIVVLATTILRRLPVTLC